MKRVRLAHLDGMHSAMARPWLRLARGDGAYLAVARFLAGGPRFKVLFKTYYAKAGEARCLSLRLGRALTR